MPPVATKLPESTEIVVENKLVSADVPVKATVVEAEYELSAGEAIAEVGLVVSISIDDEQPETVELVALSILVILYA